MQKSTVFLLLTEQNIRTHANFEAFKSRSSGLRRNVVLWQDTNVSEVRAASIFRVTNIRSATCRGLLGCDAV